MNTNFKIESLEHGLSIENQLDKDTFLKLVNNALILKRNKINKQKLLHNKKIVLLFEKLSTRTRCAFETAAYNQGANVTYIDIQTSHIGRDESLKDTARVLGRYFDGIEYRGYKEDIIYTLRDYSNIPVWNGLTDNSHPTQALADIMTVIEYSDGTPLNEVPIAFIGDIRNNIAQSLVRAAKILGLDLRLIGPEKLYPEELNSNVICTSDLNALKDVRFIYTDIWLSMGESADLWDERISLLRPYRVTKELMSLTGVETYFMHCLPSMHNRETLIGELIYDKYGLDGIEVDDEVFESDRSIVFDQAENRMHTIEALILGSLL